MEKRTIYRITGILAMVGLAVVVLPLFMDNEEAPLSPTIVQAPAFPDQAIADQPQVTDNSEVSTSQNVLPVDPAAAQAQSMATPEAVNNVTNPATPSTDNKQVTTANAPEITPSEAKPGISDVTDSAPMLTETEAPAPEKVIKKPAVKKVATAKKVAEKKSLSRSSSPIKLVQQKSAIKPLQVSSLETDQGLLGLKKSAWVIQIGSFKSKSNAIKMANHLRANGYNAFMQDMTSSYGPSTRVFIGPEYKQASATALVKQLEAELHLHGIIVSYNPLVL